MISSPTVKTLLEQNTTIQTNIGCTIEYNMNSMVDNITVTGTDYVRTDGAKPYQKLFPASSVVKPFRPLGAGVKYGVYGDVSLDTWKDPKKVEYPLNYRTYYTGVDTYYKYWLTQKAVGVNLAVTYNNQTVLTNKIVVRFEISHSIPATWTVYKEGDVVLATGTSAAIKPFLTNGVKNLDAGTLILYYNGTSWVTTEPATIAAPIPITSLKLITPAVTTPTRTLPEVSGSHIGVIELSPRWVTDLTDHVVGFSIDQESSTSADDILPIGKVSANSISMDLVSYESTRKVITYEKGTAFDSSKLYMYKSAEIKPYIKVYYSGAPYTDSKGQHERVKQGTFYIDNWNTSEFGDISLSALDGAKYLQDISCPGMVSKDSTSVGIIRRLLDNVGFTNYNINYKTKVENGITSIDDESILSPFYWWTDDGESVWNAIQELCRDSQMVATFDENNVLQFYTRDYLFSQTTTHWNFKYSKDGSILPNIISFQKRDLPAVNQVKVLWSPVTSSQLIGDGQPLWKSGSAYLGAYSLVSDIPASISGGGAGTEIQIIPITVNQDVKQIIYNYSGYLVIDSEIIEYDAIEYQYLHTDGSIKKEWITQLSDLQKIASNLSLSRPANQIIAQTGKIKIKSRGAFGTSAVAHSKTGSVTGWNGFENVFKSSSENSNGTSTSANVSYTPAVIPDLLSVPPTAEEPISGTKLVQKSLFQITSSGKPDEKNKYSIAVKNMDINTDGNHYNIGTGLFFKGTKDDTKASGGIGFFTSSNGLDGYYIKLETTSNLSESGSDRPLSIFKVKNGVIKPLQDSQEKGSNKSLAYLTQGVSYKVDIRIRIENSVVVIDVFINNFRITAADSQDIISPTKNVSLFSNVNSTFFDYVYSIPLSEQQYKDGVIGSQYSGRFGSTTLDFLYGDKLSSTFQNSGIAGGAIDEFGTVARELLKVNIKYDSRPAFPIITSLGLNQFVEVLGYRLNSFGAEVYVLNNAGTFIPLDDSRFASFSVIGNTLVQSGQNEYLDKTINEFTVPEQVTFESVWIQREEDAKSLSKFIKEQWSKKQSVCELEIFSNPLISVGDIVTINYPSNGLDGTQKFMVSSINNSFDGGLSTKITTRSIYSL
jgi:hypothetical protein